MAIPIIPLLALGNFLLAGGLNNVLRTTDADPTNNPELVDWIGPVAAGGISLIPMLGQWRALAGGMAGPLIGEAAKQVAKPAAGMVGMAQVRGPTSVGPQALNAAKPPAPAPSVVRTNNGTTGSMGLSRTITSPSPLIRVQGSNIIPNIPEMPAESYQYLQQPINAQGQAATTMASPSTGAVGSVLGQMPMPTLKVPQQTPITPRIGQNALAQAQRQLANTQVVAPPQVGWQYGQPGAMILPTPAPAMAAPSAAQLPPEFLLRLKQLAATGR